MRTIRSGGICLAVVLLICAIAAGGALAAAPEIGRCAKVAVAKTGHYSSATCTKAKTGGEYEWSPGAVKTHFTGVGGAATLETVAKVKVACSTEASSGEFTSPKTAGHILVTFTNCTSLQYKCSTAGAAVGEIKTNPLAGTIVWENKAKKKAALDLVPEATELFVEFACGPANDKVKGSVLVNVVAGKMLTTITEKFTAKTGKQKPEYYETATGEKVKDVLLSKLGATEFEQAGQTVTNTQTDEEALEVNWAV